MTGYGKDFQQEPAGGYGSGILCLFWEYEGDGGGCDAAWCRGDSGAGTETD